MCLRELIRGSVKRERRLARRSCWTYTCLPLPSLTSHSLLCGPEEEAGAELGWFKELAEGPGGCSHLRGDECGG